MNKTRIKLAEAMGWIQNAAGDWHNIPNGKLPRPEFDLPDPEIDANDDYAVLEYMRKQHFVVYMTHFLGENAHPVDYKIGDYARAALKALEIK